MITVLTRFRDPGRPGCPGGPGGPGRATAKTKQKREVTEKYTLGKCFWCHLVTEGSVHKPIHSTTKHNYLHLDLGCCEPSIELSHIDWLGEELGFLSVALPRTFQFYK